MILIIHIIIAISSLLIATYLLIKPSQKAIYGSYSLIASTIITGTYIIVAMGASIVKTCLTGLIYLGVTLSITAYSHVKINQTS
jgi:hypothetical protein